METIAEEAGFSKGAVYSRFHSKADLFLAMLQELNEERTEAIAIEIEAAASIEDVIEAAKAWWIVTRDTLVPEPGLTMALVEYWASAAQDPEIAKQVSEEHERMLAVVAEVLDRAVSRLGATLPYPSIDIVRMLSAVSRGLTLERYISDGRADDSFTQWLLDALLPHSFVPKPRE